MAEYCLYCGIELPEKTRRLYCSTKCRRDAQNERRREERAEFREAQEAAKQKPMGDPYDLDFIATLDWWEAAEVYSNSMLEPHPCMTEMSYDRIQRSYRVLQDKELAKPAKMRQGWLM